MYNGVFSNLISRVLRGIYQPMNIDASWDNQQANALDSLYEAKQPEYDDIISRVYSGLFDKPIPEQAQYFMQKDNVLGSQVSEYESGAEGINSIGYDKNGGTSYGIYQHSSRMGGMDDFLNLLAASGAEGAAAAAAIRAAGPLNTGSKTGPAVDAYLAQAAKYPELFRKVQHDTIYNNLYAPMLDKIPVEARSLIDQNPALQEMAWSTAVQHGGAGGASVLRKAYQDGMTPENYVRAVYQERGRHFPSSTAKVRAAVQNRFAREANKILGLLNSGYGTNTQDKAKTIIQSWGYR